MTLLEMYNLCLSRLGSRQVLTGTTGTDPATLAIAGSYPVARDELLRSHTWPFATAACELQEVAAIVPQWSYAYAYPETTLAVVRIYSDSTPDGRTEEYAVQSNEDGTDKLIVTNVSPAYAKRVVAVTDPARFDADFVDALAYKVAADLAMPLANDMNLREHLLKIHYQVLNQALVAAGRERTLRIPPAVGRYRGARQ